MKFIAANGLSKYFNTACLNLIQLIRKASDWWIEWESPYYENVLKKLVVWE